MRRYQFRGHGWLLLSGLVLLGLGGAAARAQEGCSTGEWLPWWKRLFIKRDPGRLYYGRGGPPHTFDQTGHPDEISKCARPSETPNYFGYYVGGGCAFHGGPPGPAEGTWGWDYAGLCFHCKRLVLNWCHRCKGGAYGGPYRIDGPKTPDIAPAIEKLKEGPGHKSEHEEEEHGGHHELEHHAEPLKGHNGGGH
jgi:hypothetical protein